MSKYLQSVLVPPIAVCRYGCAGCCAAPIAVFWIAGLASLIYGYTGGPLNLEGISWNTMALGVVLWVIAAVWATVTVHNVEDEACNKKNSSFCKRASTTPDESDPLDEVRKTR